MKPLSPEQIEYLSQRVQRPWYLVDITLDQEYHLTTGERITVGGVTYEPGRLRGLQEDAGGVLIQHINDDYQHTMAALRGDYQRNAVSVALAPRPELLYVDEDDSAYVDQAGVHYVAQEGVEGRQIITGGISSITAINEWLVIAVMRQVGRTFPAQRIVPPLANYTRPEGTLIPVNQSVYRIATRSRRA